MEVKIKAIHEAELKKYLDSLGILEGILKGNNKCRHCDEIISLDNFLCMYPIDNTIAISCNKPTCYIKALDEARDVLQVD